MTGEGSNAAIERVWRKVLADPRSALETGLTPSDLQTLFLAVSRTRAATVTPARLMTRWTEDPYVQPAASDPRHIWKIEARLWDLLPEGFVGVDLSPVTPLGTCSSVAPVHQDRVVSTLKGTEVVSDPTNVLALEASRRRRATSDEMVRLAACHRVLRAGLFDGPGLFQHFRLFVLVSSGRDRGSGSTEAAMLIDHLRFWTRALNEIVPTGRSVIEFSAWDAPVALERFRDTVLPAVDPLSHSLTIEERPDRQRARGYYNPAAIRMSVAIGDASLEIGDGGFTDWTAQLTSDAKERCLISCVATERLAQLAHAG